MKVIQQLLPMKQVRNNHCLELIEVLRNGQGHQTFHSNQNVQQHTYSTTTIISTIISTIITSSPLLNTHRIKVMSNEDVAGMKVSMYHVVSEDH